MVSHGRDVIEFQKQARSYSILHTHTHMGCRSSASSLSSEDLTSIILLYIDAALWMCDPRIRSNVSGDLSQWEPLSSWDREDAFRKTWHRERKLLEAQLRRQIWEYDRKAIRLGARHREERETLRLSCETLQGQLRELLQKKEEIPIDDAEKALQVLKEQSIPYRRLASKKKAEVTDQLVVILGRCLADPTWADNHATRHSYVSRIITGMSSQLRVAVREGFFEKYSNV